MEYIAYLHKDRDSDYGVSFPDFPGCITAGRTLDEASRMAAEALALHIQGMIEDGDAVPEPSKVDDIAADAAKRGAVAFLVSVDAPDATVRVNITARESQMARIDALAEAAGLTRSGYMVRAAIPFFGRRTRISRQEAIELYILLRLRTEDIRRLSFLVEGFYKRTIQIPNAAPFSYADLKDTVRTAFFGWFAGLTDKDNRAVYPFDPLLVLFPDRRPQIIKVQMECEACHGVLQQFRNNVAFHSRSKIAMQVEARRALSREDTFLDLESARKDFLRLMLDLTSQESSAIPELPEILKESNISHHPAFANLFSAVTGAK
jgi:predicted RNase H-like HicB family nuclease